MSNLKSLSNIQLPLIRMESSQHEFEEARLPGTIGPGDANSVTPIQGE